MDPVGSANWANLAASVSTRLPLAETTDGTVRITETRLRCAVSSAHGFVLYLARLSLRVSASRTPTGRARFRALRESCTPSDHQDRTAHMLTEATSASCATRRTRPRKVCQSPNSDHLVARSGELLVGGAGTGTARRMSDGALSQTPREPVTPRAGAGRGRRQASSGAWTLSGSGDRVPVGGEVVDELHVVHQRRENAGLVPGEPVQPVG